MRIIGFPYLLSLMVRAIESELIGGAKYAIADENEVMGFRGNPEKI